MVITARAESQKFTTARVEKVLAAAVAGARGLPRFELRGHDSLKANAMQVFKTKGVTSFKTV